MAPEVLFKDKEGHTYQSDFYAMGVLLYYFLMDKYPYKSQDRKKLRAEMELLEDKSINFADIDQDKFPDKSIVDITNKLLNRDQNLRIGHIGTSELKEDPYFKDFDWSAL